MKATSSKLKTQASSLDFAQTIQGIQTVMEFGSAASTCLSPDSRETNNVPESCVNIF